MSDPLTKEQQTVASHHVDAGNSTRVLYKPVLKTTEPSLQPLILNNIIILLILW